MILLVEDDDDTREMLATCLALQGYEVVAAANGQEALGILDGRTPALIVVDLMMPVMDGVAFRDAQRRHPTASAVPVVVLTAAAHGRQVAETIEADVFLAKPVELSDLIAVVARVLRTE